MGKRILLPVDGNELARQAYELARELFPGETFVLLHVVNPTNTGFSMEGTMPNFPDGWYEQQKSHAKRLFDEIETWATEDGIEIERVIQLGTPARKILDVIEDKNVDHVVMASHGRKGVPRLVMGSTAENVVRSSPVPVTVAP